MFATPPRQKRTISVGNSAETIKEQHIEVVVREGRLRVSATTLGAGPLIMLAHGWGGSAVDMMPLARGFALSGFRAVTFDMPGHGMSPGKESSLVLFLSAMRAVSDALGAPEVIVGHSFGGAAAVFGITELALPVRAAVLISPAPGPAYYVDRFARTIGLPAERKKGMTRRLVERVGRSIESLDALVAARNANVPAMIFHDPADREVPFHFAEQMAESWRGSRLVPMPNLGHTRILRDATLIQTAVNFVATSPASSLVAHRG